MRDLLVSKGRWHPFMYCRRFSFPWPLQVLADSTGILQMDSCDFSGSMAQSLVSVADGDNVQPAVIRNARLGTANYEAIK